MDAPPAVDRLPLLLLPGLLCDAAVWSRLGPALALGAQPLPAAPLQGSSIADMADAVLAAAPPRFALAGFSMGGQVAMEVCARAPGRVERLALLSTNDAGLSPLVREHLGRSIGRIAADGLEGYLADAFGLYFTAVGLGDATMRPLFVDMGRRVGAATALRQLNALLDYPGFDLRTIRCPTLLACGALDLRTSPEVHAGMAARIADAELVVLPGAGHFTMLEAPEALTQALAGWLRRPIA